MKKCQCPIHLLCYRLTSSRQQQQKHCYSQTRFDFGKNCFSRFRRPKRCQASDFYAREKKILDSNPHSISTCTAFCPLIYFVNILHSAKRINHIRLCFFFFFLLLSLAFVRRSRNLRAIFRWKAAVNLRNHYNSRSPFTIWMDITAKLPKM